MNEDELIRCVVHFLTQIGITIVERPLSDDTFLPGIKIESGSIVFDPAELRYPGDLLHEAGHLAVVPSAMRAKMADKVQAEGMNENAVESAAMLWSYAAALHLNIDPAAVFHTQGYNGKAAALLFGFELGVFIGLPFLEEAGMTVGPAAAEVTNVSPFPRMLKWLRD